MIVVCDTFDHSDYPVYVGVDENIHDKKSRYDGESMQEIVEVYNLRMDMNSQMSEKRTFNY
jgi:hypothetical protein